MNPKPKPSTEPVCQQPGAAVAVVLARASQSILLVRRKVNVSDPWSGQWAFPGGRRDIQDPDLRTTSQRETLEECGVKLTDADLWKPLPVAFAGRRKKQAVLVAPYLYTLDSKTPLQPEMTEIASAKWQPIDYLAELKNHKRGVIAPHYSAEEFPYIEIESVPLWGFTYRVLMQALELIQAE